jgi:hypothetical protein
MSEGSMPKYLNAAKLVALLLPLVSPFAHADDGGISFGGSPHLLEGHATIALKDEVVKMDVSEKTIKVDCKFLFHNDGPACTVRVDPKATFITYESWVDGKKVNTEVVATNDRSLYWHTKTVTFKANSDCIIRDLYTLPPGAQVTNENGGYQQTYYVLHTGASWHGPIGRAEIIVNFAPGLVAKPMQVKALSSVTKLRPSELKWSTLPQRVVLYEGLSQPKVEANTLRFVRTNFKPTKQDDVHLYYGYKQLTNTQ